MIILYEHLEFDPIKEPWNIYKLADGSLLKTRFILVNVIMEGVDEAKNPVYFTNSDNVVGIAAPKEILGEPSGKFYTSEDRIDAIVDESINFETKSETWNEYKFSDGTTFKVKLVLTKVAKTSLYDSKGQPLYLVKTQPLYDVSVPNELRQKLKKLG